MKCIKKLTRVTKELIKLAQQLNKLAFEVISLIGWFLIILQLLK